MDYHVHGLGREGGRENISCSNGNGYITSVKNISIQMLNDIGMVVPKIIST